MRIAVPVANKRFCMRLGHCQVFAFFDVDENEIVIRNREELPPPPFELGILPQWIKEQGADIVLAGDMGQRAQGLFNDNGVEVILGVTENNPAQAVLNYSKHHQSNI